MCGHRNKVEPRRSDQNSSLNPQTVSHLQACRPKWQVQGKWYQQGKATELGDFTVRHLGFERSLQRTSAPLPESKEGRLEAKGGVKGLNCRWGTGVVTGGTTTLVADTTAATVVCPRQM